MFVQREKMSKPIALFLAAVLLIALSVCGTPAPTAPRASAAPSSLAPRPGAAATGTVVGVVGGVAGAAGMHTAPPTGRVGAS